MPDTSSFSLRGAQLAAKEINDAGGIGGRKIAVISGDSQGTPVEGVSATLRLIDLDKAEFIIGDVSSSVTLALQPVVEDAGVLPLNAAALRQPAEGRNDPRTADLPDFHARYVGRYRDRSLGGGAGRHARQEIDRKERP